MKRRYTVLFVPDVEDGGYTVHVPALPGCITEGDTYAEALENAIDAIRLTVAAIVTRYEEAPVEERHEPLMRFMDIEWHEGSRVEVIPRNPPGSTNFSQSQAAQRGRIGALTMHALHDPRETTAAARATFLSRFEQQVDPDRTLPEAERARRAEFARKAHFARLAFKSAQVRAANAKARRESAEDE